MGFISATKGISSAIGTIGKSTLDLPVAKPYSLMAATAITPGLTGRGLGDYAMDPASMYDPAYSRIQGEGIIGTAAAAPGALWRGTVKASLLFGTIPRIASTMSGMGAPSTGKIMPLGLRTLMYGGKGFTRTWGFGAGAMLTGSPLGGLFMGGVLGGMARGTLFGKNVGLGGGGLLGIIGQTKGGAAVEKWFRNNLAPDKFTASITRTRARSTTDRYINKYDWARMPGREKGPEAKPARETLRTTTRQIKGFDWIQKDRVNQFDRQLNNVLATRRNTEFMRKGMSREQLDTIIEDFGTKRKPGTVWVDPTGRQTDLPGSTGPWGRREGFVRAGKDVYRVGRGREYNIAPLRKLGVAHVVAGNIKGRIMKDLLGGKVSGAFGVSGLGFMRTILNPEKMTMMTSQVDLVNDKLEKLEQSLKRTKIGKGIEKTTEKITKASKRAQHLGYSKRVVKETVKDIATTGTYRLNMGKMMGQAGLVHLSRYLKAMYIYGGVKKIGGAVISNALNTVKTVTSISRNMGRMEFGTGKTLDTRMASTERSRAIMAMQNVGISARSYLGQEAAITAQG